MTPSPQSRWARPPQSRPNALDTGVAKEAGRGGEAVPSEAMLEVMKAYRNWALRYCPWTLEEWE